MINFLTEATRSSDSGPRFTVVLAQHKLFVAPTDPNGSILEFIFKNVVLDIGQGYVAFEGDGRSNAGLN